MRKIKIIYWKSQVPIYKDGKIVGSQEGEENLLMAINVLIGNKKPEEMKRGLDLFRTMNRIGIAFDKAEKTKVLELEETDYSYLKDIIERDVPSIWGMNANLSKALEDFLSAKAE